MLQGFTKLTLDEVITWWKEYGFTAETRERSDEMVLFGDLLSKMDSLNDDEQLMMFEYLYKIYGAT